MIKVLSLESLFSTIKSSATHIWADAWFAQTKSESAYWRSDTTNVPRMIMKNIQLSSSEADTNYCNSNGQSRTLKKGLAA